MCGIVAYIGNKDPKPIIIGGLQRLEYRGYDSAGILVCNNTKYQLTKITGKVNALSKMLETKPNIAPHLGIGHTRWASHGIPNDKNAHPHYSNSGKLYMVHNELLKTMIALKWSLSSGDIHFIPKQIPRYW